MDETMDLDDPSRIHELRQTITHKPALRSYYVEVYKKYLKTLSQCPAEGGALEIGSGAGFVKELIPNIITSDVLPYDGVDRIVDGTKMPFTDGSLRFIGMLNVFHHIPDVESFLSEAQRCLKPGGRLLILDQHPGWFSSFIYKNMHHEPFHLEAKDWKFDSKGPLSGANGALAWIVFQRDRKLFIEKFPKLSLLNYEPNTPLKYWLSGGLKKWSLLPAWAFGLATIVDKSLIKISKDMGSFVDIEIERKL